MQQPNYYSIIPASVRYSKLISGNEKLLYSELTCLANKFGYCYASNKYFADLYGVSKKTITRRLANLKKCGFINIVIDRNEKSEIVKRRIYLLDIPVTNDSIKKPNNVPTPIDNIEYTPMDKTDHTPMDNFGNTPMDKSVSYSNTRDINNTSISITRENREIIPSSIANDILSAYNNICHSLSPYPKIRNDDKQNIRCLLDSGIDYSALFQRVEQSDFLSGRNGKWNGCSFSWIINTPNTSKIIAGNYDNPLKQPSKCTNKFFELAMSMEDNDD
jgi:hypothetical protein